MKWKCSKVLNSHIFGHYVQFSAHVTHSKDPYTSKIVQPRPHILPKVYINLYYQKNVFKTKFFEVEMPLKCPKVIYLVILIIPSGPPTHSKAPYTSIEVDAEAHILP